MAHVTRDRVLETSTTTGGGNITLAGAVTGFQSFGGVMSNADTCFYSLWGVDANNTPTGEYETGLGTYSASTLARTTIHTSSNSNATVTLSAGTKLVALANNAREMQRLPTAQLASTATVATVTLTAAAGWVQMLEANATYELEVVAVCQTAVTSTGIGMVLDVPTSATVCGMVWTPVTVNTLGCAVQNSDAALVSTTSVTTGVINPNANQPIFGKWIVATQSTAGTAHVMVRSEIANSTAQIQPSLSFFTGRRIL